MDKREVGGVGGGDIPVVVLTVKVGPGTETPGLDGRGPKGLSPVSPTTLDSVRPS